MSGSVRWLVAAASLLALASCRSGPQAAAGRAASAAQRLALPGHAFAPLPLPGGERVLVSLVREAGPTPGALALVRVAPGAPQLERVLDLPLQASGLAATKDGALLAVAMGESVGLWDLPKLLSGDAQAAALGRVELGPGKLPDRDAGSVLVAFADQDRLLLSTDEWAERVTVIDVARAKDPAQRGSAILGAVPVGALPVGIAVAPDGRLAYVTSQFSKLEPDELHPAACPPEVPKGKRRPQGTISVIDVERSRTEPATAVVGTAPAGCSPVRVALSPGGKVAYVTARNANAVLAFDTWNLREKPLGASLGSAQVGSAPVGIAVGAGGRALVVALSNRFAADGSGQIAVVDSQAVRTIAQPGAAAPSGAASSAPGAPVVLTSGPFPRDVAVSADGRTAYVAVFSGDALEVLNLGALLRP